MYERLSLLEVYRHSLSDCKGNSWISIVVEYVLTDLSGWISGVCWSWRSLSYAIASANIPRLSIWAFFMASYCMTCTDSTLRFIEYFHWIKLLWLDNIDTLRTNCLILDTKNTSLFRWFYRPYIGTLCCFKYLRKWTHKT